MDWFAPSTLVSGGVVIFLALIVMVSYSRILDFLLRQQEAIERFGDRARRFKYQRLVPWVGRLPVSADFLTLSRLWLIGGSLICFVLHAEHAWLGPFVIPLFSLGWFTDYLDGLVAEAEAQPQRRGHATAHGKYLDPCVDMVCFALMGAVLQPHYPGWIMLGFAGAILARTLLFLVLMLGRLSSQHWRQRLPSTILPKTITGEVKAAMIAVSFGLVLFGPTNATHLFWSRWMLVIAIIFEAASLGYLIKYAHQKLSWKPPVLAVVPQKTGSE